MPQIAPIVIKDGAVAPVDHTFSPNTTNGSKGEWFDRSAPIPSGFSGLTSEVRYAKQAGAAHRVIMGLNCPVTTSIEGVPTVVHNSSAQVVFNFSTLSSEQERKDMLAMMANLLANASVKTSVTNIEPFY